MKCILTSIILVLSVSVFSLAESPRLTLEEASRLASLPLKSLQREYPNKIGHVLTGPEHVASPKELHPAFYGSYDWHSSVHGHWMLVRLLKLYPNMREAPKIRAILNENLSAENIKREVEYIVHPKRASFERPYGWGWLLKLAEELHTWDDPQGQQWSSNLEPLAEVIRGKYIDFFPRQTYPIRSGTHNNTCLGMTFAVDYARATDSKELENVMVERAYFYFATDKNFPAQWEPGGDHFLSPALTEADLMRRMMPSGEFAQWLSRFLPQLREGEPKALLMPATVSDRSDPKIVHLDGLNLSRAWAMYGIASSLPESDPRVKILRESAQRHAEAALKHVTSGEYEGEHWLASFAVYLLSQD